MIDIFAFRTSATVAATSQLNSTLRYFTVNGNGVMKKLPHEEGNFRRNSSFPNDVRPSFRHKFDSDKIPTRYKRESAF